MEIYVTPTGLCRSRNQSWTLIGLKYSHKKWMVNISYMWLWWNTSSCLYNSRPGPVLWFLACGVFLDGWLLVCHHSHMYKLVISYISHLRP